MLYCINYEIEDCEKELQKTKPIDLLKFHLDIIDMINYIDNGTKNKILDNLDNIYNDLLNKDISQTCYNLNLC